jgi:hypothetical protein
MELALGCYAHHVGCYVTTWNTAWGLMNSLGKMEANAKDFYLCRQASGMKMQPKLHAYT